VPRQCRRDALSGLCAGANDDHGCGVRWRGLLRSATGAPPDALTVRVAVRHPDHARIELQSIGWVTVVPADVRDQASVAAAIAGADAVVRCKGQHATVLQLPVTSAETVSEGQRYGSPVA